MRPRLGTRWNNKSEISLDILCSTICLPSHNKNYSHDTEMIAMQSHELNLLASCVDKVTQCKN